MISPVTGALKKHFFRRLLLALLLLVVALVSAAVTTLAASQWRNTTDGDATLASAGVLGEGFSADEYYLRQQIQHLLMAVVAPNAFRATVSLQPVPAELSRPAGEYLADHFDKQLSPEPASVNNVEGGRVEPPSLLSKNVLILVDNAIVADSTVDQIYQLVYQGLGLQTERRDVLKIEALPFVQFDWAVALRDSHLWAVFLATFWLVLLASALLVIPWRRLRGARSADSGNVYQDELRRLRYIATDEPGRVANVLADWLQEGPN